MIRISIILAILGHIMCGVCDCLLSYSNTGRRLDFKVIKDPQKMHEEFRDMPLSFPLLSMVLGTFSITLFGFGYFALSKWMKDFSIIASDDRYHDSRLCRMACLSCSIICNGSNRQDYTGIMGMHIQYCSIYAVAYTYKASCKG